MLLKRFLLSTTAAAGLLLAACGQRPITAEEIVDRMQQTRTELQSLQATIEIDYNSPEETGRFVIEAWGAADTPGTEMTRLRAEVRESSQAEFVGAVFVRNGDQVWMYSPEQNTVYTGTKPETDSTALTDPLAATEQLQAIISEGLEAVDLDVLGEERVAGQPAWKVRVTPTAETSSSLNLTTMVELTMWVDQQRALPLKLTVDAGDYGSGTIAVSRITVNGNLDAALFNYTAPAGANLVELENASSQATSLEEARAAVDFPLLSVEGSLAGAQLSEVRMIGNQTVIQIYSGPGISFSVVAATGDFALERELPAGSQTEQVQVRGQNAELVVADGENGGTLLRWEENTVRYLIAGPIDRDTAIEIAAALR